MPRPALFIVAFGTAVSALSGYAAAEELEGYRKELCHNPNYTDPDDFLDCPTRSATMHIYNNITKKCEQLPDSICRRDATFGVFYTFFDCVQTCARDTGAPFCAEDPYMKCNETDAGRIAFFYNKTTQECEKYRYCGNESLFEVFEKNGFFGGHFCNLGCRGFNNHNMNGWNPPECAVSCLENPPAANCTEDDYEAGLVRYYYNKTTGECTEYRVCHWEKDLNSLNYFVTQQLCQEECGHLNMTVST